MSASAAPSQGDHVFNAIEGALMAPFETIRSFRSTVLDVQHFLSDALLQTFSFARRMADQPELRSARSLVAGPNSGPDAVRIWARLQAGATSPAINAGQLRIVHDRNSVEFGAAARRFEIEMLTAIRQALETALDANVRAGGRQASPGIACQQMLNAAYDPAAALVLLLCSMDRETRPMEFCNTVLGVARTLDRPGMWRDPYVGFRENRPTDTGRQIVLIRDVLTRIDLLKAQSMTFAGLIRNDISHNMRLPGVRPTIEPMLHLIHARLQLLGG